MAEPVPMPQAPSEATAAVCAATWQERLADARQAVLANQAYMQVHRKYIPWFREHCRFLTEFEIAARKLDDPHAFVCDTQKGRPKGLTSEIAVEYDSPTDPHVYQKHFMPDVFCEPHDVLERVSLVLRDDGTRAYFAKEVGAMCWRVESDECTRARAAVAASAAPATTTAPGR